MFEKYLNFDAKNDNQELFGIPEERLSEIQDKFNSICDDIGVNYEEYVFKCDCGNPNCEHLLVGKCLARLRGIAKDEREEVFIMFASATFLRNCGRIIGYFQSLNTSSQ